NYEEGYYTCTVHVKYEWKPSSCSCCKVFGHTQEEYPKNIGVGVATNNSRGNKKKHVKHANEVSNSNRFDVLNTVDNDMELGTNGGLQLQVIKGLIQVHPRFGMSRIVVIIDKIGKYENLIIDEQAILMDDDGNPLKKVEYLGDHDSEDEVALVDDDMAHSMALKRVGFGTQSLLEQWRDSYGNGDYDDDPYDDDMYEG
nr:hypothetical protein [Tanacetum cinerariifolium]